MQAYMHLSGNQKLLEQQPTKQHHQSIIQVNKQVNTSVSPHKLYRYKAPTKKKHSTPHVLHVVLLNVWTMIDPHRRGTMQQLPQDVTYGMDKGATEIKSGTV